MMSDRKFGPTKSRRLHGLEPIPDLDMLENSELPQVQEIRLYRELNKELEKNSDRLRYLDSELYSKMRERSLNTPSSSEIQSTTVNIGLSPQVSRTNSKVSNSNVNKKFPTSRIVTERDEDDAVDIGDQDNALNSGQERALVLGGNCQVCLIKGLRDDLTNITKVIQERNEQLISKLKARRMRSFFERQMLD